MRIRTFVVGSLALLGLSLAAYGQAQAQSQAGLVKTADDAHAFFQKTCAVCHGQAAKKAGLEPAQRMFIDGLDPAHVEKNPERWEAIVRKLRAGMMPPSGMPRPKPEVMESAIEFIENALDRAAVTMLPPPGLHRMNRTEYTNSIRDLLDLQVDASKFLPADDSTRGFDNIAAALGLSPALLEGYTSAAGKISRLAIGDVTTPTQVVYRVPEDTSQDYHIEGMPFGTRGGMIVKNEFPANGDYAIKITPISKGNMGDTNPFGEITGEKLEFLLDGQRLKVFDWDKERVREDGTFNFKFHSNAGLHTVVVTFIATNYAPGNDLDQHFLRDTIETGGLPGFKFFPHVGKIRIDGPNNPTAASDTPSRRKIFICHPASAGEETGCATKIVNKLAREAFRRPITPEDTEAIMSFYQQGHNEGGSFDSGIELALRRILADPQFVFRKETVPENAKPGQPYRISDIELASRLSFFLWSSIPDEELLTLASQNKLHEPEVLQKQVLRMLADERSNQLVDNWAGQWLQLRALRSQTPVTATFPDFDDNLRNAMQKEMELFVDNIVHADRPVTELIDANYTFLNERLAKHYGIPNIYGSDFRRVTLAPEFAMRRGLLGKGAFETISSKPGGTMPPIRGKTVMQVFLGVEPPPPPPVIPALKDVGNTVHGGHKPTMREQMEMHRKVEPCASCHKIMDPIGLSLENFDAVGHWRTEDDGSPIDAAGMLVDGTKIDGVNGLRTALLKYTPEFVRVATEKLLIYALGRGTEYYDMPLVRSIVHEAAKDDYRFSSLVLGVVKSPEFQMNELTQDAENESKPQLRASR
jgi:mono/diheme cytochrome c family protein